MPKSKDLCQDAYDGQLAKGAEPVVTSYRLDPISVVPLRPPAAPLIEEELEAHDAAIVAALKRGLKKAGVR